MISHGADKDSREVQYALDNGIVRVEVELKKRLLSELGLNRWDNLSDAALASVFHDQTAVFRGVDMSDEPDILAAVPVRSRALAAAWMAGQDVHGLCSRATLFRHARVLREFGLDIMQHRNVETFPVRVRTIDLEPLTVPDWYDLKVAA